GFCSFILVIWSAFTLFSDFYCIVCQFITSKKRRSYKNSSKTFLTRKGILGKLKGKAYKLLKAYEGGTIGKENRRKSQAQRGKGRNFLAC
ncbi:hypothetical protein, partial [Parabacteroides distasonis]|uniref:hypothetical protein n=1 Tax=Parabacteroides distasonis TaxID=823 RepID=UPI001D136D4D